MSTTTAASTTGTPVIATVEALTTVFSAPSTCNSMQLTQLSSPGYQIWLNEPQPVPGTIYPNCYPTEWINGYSSVSGSGSSIVPMMSPLVAPENWITAFEGDNGYIALCPSGFQLHSGSITVDTNRPAYGATCYSQFTEGMTVTVSGFDSQKYTGTVLFSPHSTDQAYAHVIEGKKASSTSSTTTAASSSLAAETSGTAAAATATATPDSSSSNSISGGAIAGAVVGSIAGVALIVLAIFLLFRRRRNHNGAGQQPIDYSSEIAAANQANGYHGDNAYPAGAAYNQEEKALPSIPDAASNHDPISPYAQSPPGYNNYAELPVNHAVELASPQESHPNMGELDGGYQGSELQNASQNHGPNHGHTTH
ncbi:hypothetical protein AB5N19_01042 [Seiridium cardinale]